MKELLSKLYKDNVDEIYQEINELIKKYKLNDELGILSERDSMLITYGDSILNKGEKPLKTLDSFLTKYVQESIKAVHLLPMFPYTSDDGFSVVDYLEINPDLGDWNDVKELSKSYDLMFDAVINHISKSSEWFKEYQKGTKEYKDFFIECDENIDYKDVVRPRSLPLYYKYSTSEGNKLLWATFSEDQLDVNYHNPKVLLKVLEVLLEYARRGAKYIRFDAIGFIWKKMGTTCSHLEETHLIVKLMRQVLEECYPNTRVISETNVPHEENITYFGNGYDEAHLIYQFPLPPLTLFSFLSGNAKKLSLWADSLKETPLTNKTTYFNFLASHDGVGLRPTEGILTEEEIQMMADTAKNKGGRIGYKNNPDGSKSPYELNINYLDAICDKVMTVAEKTQKFIASQFVLLSLQGVPGIYVHSLLGSRNDIKGMEESNISRRINREKLNLDQLEEQLKDTTSLRHNILKEYLSLLDTRSQYNAFSPSSAQEVLFIDDRVFSIIRENKVTKQKIMVLINVSNQEVAIKTNYTGKNILNGEYVSKENKLSPYQYVWILIGG